MRLLVVLALLSLLLRSGHGNEKYYFTLEPREPQTTFGFPDFTVSRKPELNFGGNARLGSSTIRKNAVELTPDADSEENTMRNPDADVVGSVFYKEPVHLINRDTTASFMSVFAFSMKPVYPSNTGDGIAFIITSQPKGTGDSLGNFGFFHHGKKKRTTLAVEFDTFKNHELRDIDNNHVGVDFGEPVSAAAISAHSVGITLNSGGPVTAWVEYKALLQRLEVRVRIGFSNHTRPEKPVIAVPLALKQVSEEDMWVGFSAGTHFGQNQLHYIYSWGFSVDYLMPDHKHPRLSTNGKTILIVLLSVSFLVLSICFILYRLRRHPQLQEDDVEEKSRAKKLADTVMQKDDVERTQKMPRARREEEWNAEENMTGVRANCLSFKGTQSDEEEEEEEEEEDEEMPIRRWLSQTMSPSPGSRRGDTQDDETIMYSNSMYTSDEDDHDDLIPVFPYHGYPDERIDTIVYNTPVSYKSPNAQSRSSPS